MLNDQGQVLIDNVPIDPARLHGPASYYVSGEDHLRLSSFNSNPDAILTLVGRFLTLQGEVVPFAFSHTPAINRTLVTTQHRLGEGWLVDAAIFASSGTPRVGQTFVVLELIRGAGVPAQSLGCLLQGYVTDTSRLAWPGSPIQASTLGRGVIRSVTGTDPAAGAEIAETVPTNARWRSLTMTFSLVTAVAVANRTVTLIVDDGANVVHQVTASAVQTASQTGVYRAYERAGAPANVGLDYYLPIPAELHLMGGYRLRTSTASLQAADNYGAPQMLVEEWIED